MWIKSSITPSLSLYHRLVGQSPILIAVEQFCDRLFGDARLAALTDGHSQDGLRVAIMALALDYLDETPQDKAKPERRLPASLSLTRQQFDRCVSHLIVALVWTQVPRPVIEEMLELVTSLMEPHIHSNSAR
jgi:hypothetical protein